MSRFVLEIGSEEIPARFLAGMEKELESRFRTALEENGIEYASMRVWSTPRRAVLMLDGLVLQQKSSEEELVGPPARIAFDAAGKPTKAAEGFARTAGVAVDALYRLQTEKGEYLAARVRKGGGKSADVLQTLCPQLIAALPFAKRMHWGTYDFVYVRPLRWILALIDDQPLSFMVGPVQSGKQTYGHRVHGAGPLDVSSADEYLEIIEKKCAVTLDAATRRACIITGGNAQAHATGGAIVWKESLLDEVQGLCEHPVPLLGDIDPGFLELPREVLLTSMESHQKSFGVENAQGQLLPHFLTVLNLSPQDSLLVKKGWERVLRARLEDARFFWKSDLATPFDTWLQTLDKVIFLGPLGSMGDKTKRLASLCTWLAEQLQLDTSLAARAGRLSKADLVSGMVGEFDTLQGIMGGIYARHKGEDGRVATALAEQYLPAGPDSPVPASDLGAVLALADKADTLAGCFGLGMIPTGTADPYALRRCALGIARIMLEKKYRFDVSALLDKAFALYGQRNWVLSQEDTLSKLNDFFTARLKNLFISNGVDTLLVEGALGAGHMDVWACGQRVEALRARSQSAQFALAIQTFKRASNIVRKSDAQLSTEWNPALLQDAAEKALAQALEGFFPIFDALWQSDDFGHILDKINEIRPAVDSFFAEVMVMCDDPDLRQNRLSMLNALVHRLGRVADFAALQR